MIYAIVVLILLILDQAAKHLALINLPLEGPAQEFIPGIIDLLRVHNKGAAFSLFENMNVRWALVILSIVFAGVVIFMIATRRIEAPIGHWMAVVVIAGALGNAIDRALFGYVIDMLRFPFWESFPVFNAADIYLTVGGVALCCYVIFYKDPDDEPEAGATEPRAVRRVRHDAPPQIGANASEAPAAARRNPAASARPAAAPPPAAPPEPLRPAIEEFMNPTPRPAAPQPRPRQPRPASAQGQAPAGAPRPRPAGEAPRQPRPAPQQAPARRPAPSAQAQDPAAAPQAAPRPTRPAAPRPAPAPQERRPAPAPAPRPKPEKTFDINEDVPEFSLDDILAEFSDKR